MSETKSGAAAYGILELVDGTFQPYIEVAFKIGNVRFRCEQVFEKEEDAESMANATYLALSGEQWNLRRGDS